METANFDIWTADNSDQYALIQDLARTADDIDEALLGLRTAYNNRAYNYGEFSTTGSVLNANSDLFVGSIVIPGTFKAGSTASLFGQVYLTQNSPVSIAGYLDLAYGGTTGYSTRTSKRWRNTGMSGRVTPSATGFYRFTADVTNPVFSMRLRSDPLSGGPIEFWDAFLSAEVMGAA